MLRDDRASLELDKLNAETRNLTNESRKFVAEERKLNRERFWYPFIIGSAVVTSLTGLIVAVANL